MKLNPIECKLTVMNYTEGWKDVCEFEKVAISLRKDEKDILEAVERYDGKTVVMYKDQYEAIFEPLFAEIRALNQQIRELNNK